MFQFMHYPRRTGTQGRGLALSALPCLGTAGLTEYELPASLMAMTTLETICSLAEFQQDTRRHLERLKKTGQPEVLTVNGKPAVVVQDTRSYEQLLDALDRAEAFAGIRHGLESMERGQGEPARLVFDRLRRKYKLPSRA